MSDKPKRRWFQFSLRTVMSLTAMVACFLAGWKARDIATYEPPEIIGIDGVVLEVNESAIRISVGSDDAVAVGTEFAVLRSGKKLGDIVVLDTSPDSAIALLKKPPSGWTMGLFAPSPDVAIQKGDAVHAKISEEQRQEMRKYRARFFETY